jgi:hypothetical protein
VADASRHRVTVVVSDPRVQPPTAGSVVTLGTRVVFPVFTTPLRVLGVGDAVPPAGAVIGDGSLQVCECGVCAIWLYVCVYVCMCAWACAAYAFVRLRGGWGCGDSLPGRARLLTFGFGVLGVP